MDGTHLVMGSLGLAILEFHNFFEDLIKARKLNKYLRFNVWRLEISKLQWAQVNALR
jgi:hypothetical protein